MVNKYDGYIFDLDGTLYLGNKVIPNVKETIDYLNKTDKKIIFVSNKTTGSIDDYYNLLKSSHVDVKKEQFLTSTIILQNYLAKNHPKSNFYAIGEELFINDIESVGLNYCEDPSKINIVLVTLDRTFTFQKLEIAAKAIENGAEFFAANIDATCPVEDGEIIDAGAIIPTLEKRTHVKLKNHFGKPSKFMMDSIDEYLNIVRDKTLIVGDRLETDIAMGNIFGIDTALVNTGVQNIANGNIHIKPTYKIESVYDIVKLKL